MLKTFLICPVRGASIADTAEIVVRLEGEGFAVHWPPRDTDQSDAIGLAICESNRKAIAAADVVHVIWDGRSQGCLFDLGMAFALGKQVVPVVLPAPSDGKSFQNMVRAWSGLAKQRAGAAE